MILRRPPHPWPAFFCEEYEVEIVVWVAFAIIIGSGGPTIINSNAAFATKEECEATNAAALAQFKANPGWDAIIAFGMSCAQITVKEVKHEPDVKKQSAPKRPSGKQSDLEKSSDPAHASPFRSTGSVS